MPALLLGLLAAAVLWARQRAAHAAPGALPEVYQQTQTTLAQRGFQPGAEAYLPPIIAPDWARVLYANAAASQNPITMAAAAQQLQSLGQVQLAQALAAQYRALTNQPLPGFSPPMAAAGVGAGVYDPRIAAALRLLIRARRARRAEMMRRLAALRLARTS